MFELRKTINQIISLPEKQVDYILSHFKIKTIAKDDYFVKIGEKCSQIAFVKTGIIRYYYPNKQGAEITCYFAFPNEFITSKYSFNTKKESKETLHAVVNTELLVIERDDVEKLFQEFPELQQITRHAYENLTTILQKRIAMFQLNSAEDRYNYLLEHHAILLKYVPLHYVASFLCVTPQHLSRLRKTKSLASSF